MIKRVEAEIGGKPLIIETGRLARQANGSVLVTYGETVVLVTATASREPMANAGFLPLTVEYQERFYSVGRIPGSYFRREIGRPSEKETLSARIIDRPLRPLFADGYRHDTQIIATVLSADQQNEPDVLAMVGASCALTISDIPFNGPIAGVRIGYRDGAYLVNPTINDLDGSRLEMVVAGSRNAVVMVEGGADSLSEEEILGAIFHAHEQIQPLIDLQEELRTALGKPKMIVTPPPVNEELKNRIAAIAKDAMRDVITTVEKAARYKAYDDLQKKVLESLPEEVENVGEVKELLHDLKKDMMRERIVVEKARIDGRRVDEIRPITSEVGILPRAHGSALFTRGETQVMVTATLGSGEDEQKVESLYGMSFKPFMLHYNFPPFCVGEVRPLRGPSRRDIGHGNLAARGIQSVLPGNAEFPYTIRVVSEVLESNGSSSMATVCGASLALMDAGIPVKKAVGGVAMGLIKEGDTVVILSDILGDEDHLGDMDFKVVGTEEGVTSLQMDIKIEGVTREIMAAALAQAKAGRLHILGRMQDAIGQPRESVSVYAPKFFTLQINPDKIRDVIGPGGKIIKAITADFNVKIDIEDSGKVMIFAPNGTVAENVAAHIKELVAEPEIGKLYKGKVQKIVEFGAFVEIMPGVDGLVHISELENYRVKKVTDVLKEGEEVLVKVLDVDQNGKIRLSRKAAMAESSAAPLQP